jgi:DNA (cytosine-5)-methyltransferase 1
MVRNPGCYGAVLLAGRRHRRRDVDVLLPTPRATDGAKGCPGQRDSHGDLTLPPAAVRVRTLPPPRASDARGPGGHGDGGADLRTTIAGLGVLDEGR